MSVVNALKYQTHCLWLRKLHEQDMMLENIESRLDIDKQLEKRIGHYIVDVWVFDDHFGKAMAVKVSHFIS